MFSASFKVGMTSEVLGKLNIGPWTGIEECEDSKASIVDISSPWRFGPRDKSQIDDAPELFGREED